MMGCCWLRSSSTTELMLRVAYQRSIFSLNSLGPLFYGLKAVVATTTVELSGEEDSKLLRGRLGFFDKRSFVRVQLAYLPLRLLGMLSHREELRLVMLSSELELVCCKDDKLRVLEESSFILIISGISEDALSSVIVTSLTLFSFSRPFKKRQRGAFMIQYKTDGAQSKQAEG
jgi:hypothetical protein